MPKYLVKLVESREYDFFIEAESEEEAEEIAFDKSVSDAISDSWRGSWLEGIDQITDQF